MSLSLRALNRATLARQLLLRREPLGIVDTVRRLVAIQAQAPASPYVALWNRIEDFRPAELDAGFTNGDVVKTKVLRMTLHAHHPDDYPAFRDAMQPSFRANGLNDRFRASGLTAGDADRLFTDLIPFVARPRTSAELKGWLTGQLGAPPHAGLWRALQFVAPLRRAPNGAPWSFGPRTSFVHAGTPAAPSGPDACAAGLRALVLRYLDGFGPASVADIALFALVQRARVKEAVTALGDQLEQVQDPVGKPLYDVPGRPRPAEDTPAPPRLLGMWDNTLLAYADRDRVIPPAYRPYVTRSNGDVLPTLLVDGNVAGVWRHVDAGIEATAFHPLQSGVWEDLAREAASLLALLADRDPSVYNRYHHWWEKLPDGDARVLPG